MPKSSLLTAPGWTDSARAQLERIIKKAAGKGQAAVFDFDNTIVCGDIGEATMGWLVREGAISAKSLPAELCPPIPRANGERFTLADAADATVYYEEFLVPTQHGAKDPAPLGNGYIWAVEAMRGLTAWDVVQATAAAMAAANGAPPCKLEVTPGKTAYPIPFFYPQIVELIATLIRHQIEVWVVSASNVWSVRWMVQHGLNPLLKKHGVRAGLPPERVIGVSTLLEDGGGVYHKDYVLVREQPAYARLDAKSLKKYTLTRWLQFPAPTYSGKVGAIWDHLGRRPWLAAGDSPGDLPMLTFAENRLWIARLEKTDYQKSALSAMRQTGPENWIVQPTLAKNAPGFLADPAEIHERLKPVPPAVRANAKLWQKQSKG